MEDEKREHDAKLKKMETEMEQVFEMKVKEKKQKLKDSEIVVSISLFYLILNSKFKCYVLFKFNSYNKRMNKC